MSISEEKDKHQFSRGPVLLMEPRAINLAFNVVAIIIIGYSLSIFGKLHYYLIRDIRIDDQKTDEAHQKVAMVDWIKMINEDFVSLISNIRSSSIVKRLKQINHFNDVVSDILYSYNGAKMKENSSNG